MATSFQWKEKVCLVTGASAGIGLGLVKTFLSRGAKCLMVDVNYRVRFFKIKFKMTQITLPTYLDGLLSVLLYALVYK